MKNVEEENTELRNTCGWIFITVVLGICFSCGAVSFAVFHLALGG